MGKRTGKGILDVLEIIKQCKMDMDLAMSPERWKIEHNLNDHLKGKGKRSGGMQWLKDYYSDNNFNNI